MRWLTVALVLICGTAFAQQDYPRDITLSWTNPNQYVDGSFIEAGDLTEILVECFRSNDPSTPVLTAQVADTGEGQPQTETFVGAIPSPGTYVCVAFAIVVDGTMSDPSNQASKKYIGKPLPPQDFT